MSKSLKIILMSALLTVLFVSLSSAAVFKVKEGGAPPFYTNLDTALWTADNYGGGPHQIEIYAGTYTTDINLVVPSNVNAITGMEDGVYFENPAPPTGIDVNKNFLDVAGSDGLTISGLHVTGYTGAVVTAGPMATNLTVENCVFDGNIVGVYVGASDGVFDNLEIMNGWMGIGINSMYTSGENIDNNTISNCSIHGMHYAPAIMLNTDENFFIPGNSNAAASVDGNQILNCTVFECSDQGIGLAGATNTTVDGCEVYDVQWAAVAGWGAAGVMIANNTVYGCAQGESQPDSATFAAYPLGPWAGGGAMSFYGGGSFTIEHNTVYDNGGLGTMGDGSAFSDYAVYFDAGSFGSMVQDNCFYGQDGVQAFDDAGNTFAGNYYGVGTVAPYLIDGLAASTDAAPGSFDASAYTTADTYEVWDIFDMTFDWTLPNCAPVDSVGLASYNFTVTFDPTKLEFVGGSGGYNEAFLGDTAFYAPIDDNTPGQVTFGAANFLAPGYGNANLAFGQFQAIGFGTVNVTFTMTTYLDGSNAPILVSNQTLTLTLEDNEAPTITVVPNNPVGDDTYSNHVDLVVTGDVADNFDLYRVQYYVDGNSPLLVQNVSGMTDTYGPFTIPFTGLAEGEHTLNMRVRDDAGNWGYTAYTFWLDFTAPAVTSITMADADGCALNAEYTNDPTVAVTIVDDGTATEMALAVSGFPEPFGPYANPTTYTLPSTDGNYQVYVNLKDAYGNESGWAAFDNITLDQVAPVPTDAWLVSNPTPLLTNLSTVDADANWGVAIGTVEYALSEDPDDMLCSGTVWAAAPPDPRPIAFTLSDDDGLKTVYFGARDLAGNIGYVTQTITVDQTPPEFLTFDAPACVKVRPVPLTLTWDGTAYPDVKYLRMGLTSGVYAKVVDVSAEDPNAATATFSSLPTTNGDYTIYAILEDEIGNQSTTEFSVTVHYDNVAPTAGTMRMNSNAAWTNSATVSVGLTGMDMDIVEVRMTQTASGDYNAPENDWVPFDPNSPTVSWTFDPVTENVNSYLWLEARDCAGNVSLEVVDAIRIDLTAPVLADLLINGGATLTNNPLVDLDFTWTELQPYQIFISEDPAMTGATTMAWAVPPLVDVFTLTGDDDYKPVYVQIADRAGNLSNIITAQILLDTHAPTGTFELVQAPPALAAPGYTNSLTVNVVNIAHDADVAQIALSNSDGTNNTGWIAPVTFYNGWNLIAGGDGTRTVRMALKDLAGNSTMWTITTSIEYDHTAPAPVATFTVTPAGSCDLEWTAGPDDQYYFFRYNPSFDYPLFTDPVPYPALDEGFFGAYVYGTEYHFDAADYPEMDLIAFSLWTVDNAGNISATPAYATGANYIPGDFNWNSQVEFFEFGDIAASYLLGTGDPGFKPTADISTAVAEDPLGLPLPDGLVAFADLNKFAQNYATFGDFGKRAAKAAVNAPIAVSAEYPAYMPQNTEFTLDLKVENVEPLLTYHFVFDIDRDKFEIVSVEPGSMYTDGLKAFFNYNENSPDLELAGAVFGGTFKGDDIARVTVRAKTNAEFDLSDLELTARGVGNEALQVSFSAVATGGLMPISFALHQNYPNPFNPTTTISFDLPRASEYNLTIYNLAGQEVKTFTGYGEPGVMTVEWNAEDVASGVYFYRLVAGEFTSSKKMVLLK